MLGHVGELGAVATLGGARERDDLGQVPHIVARGQPVFVRRTLEVMVADIIGAAFEQRDGDGSGQRVTHQGQVAFEELVLQRLGARRDDHLAAVQQRRHQIRERLPGAGSCFRDELSALRHRGRDRLRHRQLLRPEPETRKRAGERSSVAKDRVERGIVGRSEGPGFEVRRRDRVHRLQFAFAVSLALGFALALGAATLTALAASGGVEKLTRTASILRLSSS